MADTIAASTEPALLPTTKVAELLGHDRHVVTRHTVARLAAKATAYMARTGKTYDDLDPAVHLAPHHVEGDGLWARFLFEEPRVVAFRDGLLWQAELVRRDIQAA